MINLSLNITSTTLTLQNISGNDITLTVGLTTNELSLSLDRGVSLETVKADSDIKNAIDNAHIQNSDTILDEGGDNEVTAEECLIAYNHSQSAHAPSYAEKNVQSDWNEVDDSEDDFIKNKPDIPTRDSLGLDTDDSPEFTDITLKALNTTAESGGEIPTTLWAWIQSVYSTIVAKSVKSHIIGLWTSLRNQNRTIRDITFSQEVSNILINTDSDGNSFSINEGESLRIVGYFPSYAPAGVTNYLYIRLSGITSSIYVSSNVLTAYFRHTLGDGQQTFVIDLELVDGFAHMNWFLQRQASGVYSSVNVSGYTTERVNSITAVQILSIGDAKLRVGSRIKLKKIKSNS